MSVWIFQVPKPSAKRLEKNRTFIIEEIGAFAKLKHKFPIPENEVEFMFEFEFHQNDQSIVFELDSNVYYRHYVEYSNSTGSRIETCKVELIPL